jgi:deoxyribodipyrimidine photo-lyase
MPDFPHAVVWLRRDLRLADNGALAEASQQAAVVTVAFVFDRTILDALDTRRDLRVAFIHRSLRVLDADLRARGSRLVVLHGDPVREIPALAARLGASAVFCGRDYESHAKTRDAAVAAVLSARGIAFHMRKDHVVFESGELRSGAGTLYRVFTPYKRAWLRRLDEEAASGCDPAAEVFADFSRLTPIQDLSAEPALPVLETLGFVDTPLWLEAGEAAALARLTDFLARMPVYGTQRDLPSVEGTSGLSAHLRFGTISIRTLVRAARTHSSAGADTWLSELIWRDFYQMILDSFPHVERGAFKPACDRIVWPGRLEHFDAWREGRTGYPLVDAAMRELRTTGWMHNRLRMVTAMFLTKDLLLDWQLGEAHFAAELLDFDLAANNGGWQWSASTGCDAVPYFRVFNPVLQSRRFDPDGTYIRRWCPELAGYSARRIHWPHDASPLEQHEAGCIMGAAYPHPVVDHAAQKPRAVALFADLTAR